MFEDRRPFLVIHYCMLHWHIFLVAYNGMLSCNVETELYTYIFHVFSNLTTCLQLNGHLMEMGKTEEYHRKR